MNYIDLTTKFFEVLEHRSLKNFFETMYCLVSSLKKQGLEKQCISQELITAVANGFLREGVKDRYKTKFENYLIYYFGFLMDLDYDYENTAKFDKIITENKVEEPKVEVKSTKVGNLKPSDFKAKEFDTEFLNMIGASKDDL